MSMQAHEAVIAVLIALALLVSLPGCEDEQQPKAQSPVLGVTDSTLNTLISGSGAGDSRRFFATDTHEIVCIQPQGNFSACAQMNTWVMCKETGGTPECAWLPDEPAPVAKAD